MAKTLFDLKSLHQIDSLANEFDQLMREAVADCRARPAIAKAREVKVTVKITPDKTDADCVVVAHHVTGKRPEKKVPDYRMDTTVNDGLKFEPHSPMNPDQGGFDFGEGDA